MTIRKSTQLGLSQGAEASVLVGSAVAGAGLISKEVVDGADALAESTGNAVQTHTYTDNTGSMP